MAVLTKVDLDQAFLAHGISDNNSLGLASNCEGADLKVSYRDGLMHVRCASCDGEVATIAVAGKPGELLSIGQWSDEPASPDMHQTVDNAVQAHMKALHAIPREARHNVVASVVCSFALSHGDPQKAFIQMSEVIAEALPSMTRQRDLAMKPTQGNG